jgi:hypothetical protein
LYRRRFNEKTERWTTTTYFFLGPVDQQKLSSI